MLERFHNTLQGEEVYWNIYDNPAQARDCLKEFHTRYNTVRPHWALVPDSGGDPVTPLDVYSGQVTTKIPKWQAWARAAKVKLDELMAAGAQGAAA